MRERGANREGGDGGQSGANRGGDSRVRTGVETVGCEQSSTVIPWRVREKRKGILIIFNIFLFFIFFLPTPGLTHNYSTFLYRMSQRKNRMEKMPLLLKKERVFTRGEGRGEGGTGEGVRARGRGGTTEISAIQMLQVFFLFFY